MPPHLPACGNRRSQARETHREARGIFLELLVIIILIIELVPIFRGK